MSKTQTQEAELLLNSLGPELAGEVTAVTESEIAEFIAKLDPVGLPADEKELGKLLPFEIAFLVLADKKVDLGKKLVNEANAFLETEEYKALGKLDQGKRFRAEEDKIETVSDVIQFLCNTVWQSVAKRLNTEGKYVVIVARKDGVVVAPTLQYPVCDNCGKRHPKWW